VTRLILPSRISLTLRSPCLVCCLSLVLGGCSNTPDLAVRARYLNARDAIANSSVILIGTVGSVDVHGGKRRGPKGETLQLWRVNIRPEVVLKGQVHSDAVTYFAYNGAVGVLQNGDLEWLQRGDRRIFLLVRDGSLMRAVTDLYANSIPYPRAVVPNVQRRERESTPELIARTLLTRAAGESPRAFAASISRDTTIALKYAGYQFVAGLLGTLVGDSVGPVRSEACFAEFDQALGDGHCLELVGGPELAQRIAEYRRRREYLRQVARDALRSKASAPLIAYTTGVEPTDPRSVLDFYEYLSHSTEECFRLTAQKEMPALRGEAAFGR